VRASLTCHWSLTLHSISHSINSLPTDFNWRRTSFHLRSRQKQTYHCKPRMWRLLFYLNLLQAQDGPKFIN